MARGLVHVYDNSIHPPPPTVVSPVTNITGIQYHLIALSLTYNCQQYCQQITKLRNSAVQNNYNLLI